MGRQSVEFGADVKNMIQRFTQFVSDLRTHDAAAEVDSPDLWQLWCQYCDAKAEWRGTKRYMGLAMSGAGYRNRKLRGHTVYYGISLPSGDIKHVDSRIN